MSCAIVPGACSTWVGIRRDGSASLRVVPRTEVQEQSVFASHTASPKHPQDVRHSGNGLAILATVLACAPLVFTAIQWVAALVCTAEVGHVMTMEPPGTPEYRLSAAAELVAEIAGSAAVLSVPIGLLAVVLALRVGRRPLMRQCLALIAAGFSAYFVSGWSPIFRGFFEWWMD